MTTQNNQPLPEVKKVEGVNLIDGVFQYLTPEEIDRIMITRIQQFARQGARNHKNKWSEGELQMRNAVVLDYICRQGLSRAETARQLSARWNCSVRTTEKYITTALQTLVKDYEGYTETVREMHLERLENLLETCLSRNNPDSALKVLDQIAKVNGLYTQKTEIAVTDVTTSFKFGNDV